MDIKKKIESLANKYSGDMIALRRKLHQYPEISFKEYRSSKLIFNKLLALKPKKLERLTETDVVAMLGNSSKNLKCVALRSDLDALPIYEKTGLSFSSKNKGVMHACGHDAHSAMLFGAAKILSELRNELNGIVKFIFQPGEEKNPGGASFLIKEGVLENPKVNAIFGQHIVSNQPPGSLGFYEGVMMASQDELYIKIIGKTGHAAKPHLTIDPIVLAAQVILGIQNITSRMTNPYDPIVITIGKIEGGSATNIIPGEVNLAGTIRTLNNKLRTKSLIVIENILKGITSSVGAKYEFHVSPGYPELNNDIKLTKIAKALAEKYIGKNRVFKAEQFMGAEDFAYYLKKVPGSFYRIGIGKTTDIHTPTMNLNEAAIPVGAGYMAYLAYRYLQDF